jgi:hypothetical protein
LYSNLRFVISASLVGCAGLIGVLALLPPTLEERLLASAELSAPPAPTCNRQNWLHFDRNCLSRRGMPWVANLPAAKEVPSPVESAPEQAAGTQASATVPASTETTASSSSTETTASSSSEASAPASTEASASARTDASTQLSPSQSSVPAAQESGQAVTASRQEAPVSPAIADAPQVATQQSEVTAPQQEASTPPVAGEGHAVNQRNVTRPRQAAPVATERHVAKPAAEPQLPAAKKTPRDARGTKPSNEALNAVRRFQDNLRDIPVSSYAADGTQRTIVIRPTSIQDVYYYSAPR